MNNQNENLSKEMALFLKEKFLSLVECKNNGVSIKDLIIDIMSSKRLAFRKNKRINSLTGDDYEDFKQTIKNYEFSRGFSISNGVSKICGLLFSKKSWDFTTKPEDVEAVIYENPLLEKFAEECEVNIAQLLDSSVETLTEDMDLYFSIKDKQGSGKTNRNCVKAVVTGKAKLSHAQQSLKLDIDFLFGANLARKIVKEDYWNKLNSMAKRDYAVSQISQSILEDVATDAIKISGKTAISAITAEEYKKAFNEAFPNGEFSYEIAGQFAKKYFRDRMLGVSDSTTARRHATAGCFQEKLKSDFADYKHIIDSCAEKSLIILQKELDKVTTSSLKIAQDAIIEQDYRTGNLYGYCHNCGSFPAFELKSMMLKEITSALGIEFDSYKELDLNEKSTDKNSSSEENEAPRNRDILEGFASLADHVYGHIEENPADNIGFDGLTAEECESLRQELGFDTLENADNQGIQLLQNSNLYDFINGKYADQSNTAKRLRKLQQPRNNVMEEYAEYRKNKLNVNMKNNIETSDFSEDDETMLLLAKDLADNSESVAGTFSDEFIAKHKAELLKIIACGSYADSQVFAEANKILQLKNNEMAD